jgi:hypothetical protein
MVYVMHRLAEGIGPCKLEPGLCESKGCLYQLVQKMTDQQTV